MLRFSFNSFYFSSLLSFPRVWKILSINFSLNYLLLFIYSVYLCWMWWCVSMRNVCDDKKSFEMDVTIFHRDYRASMIFYWLSSLSSEKISNKLTPSLSYKNCSTHLWESFSELLNKVWRFFWSFENLFLGILSLISKFFSRFHSIFITSIASQTTNYICECCRKAIESWKSRSK